LQITITINESTSLQHSTRDVRTLRQQPFYCASHNTKHLLPRRIKNKRHISKTDRGISRTNWNERFHISSHS